MELTELDALATAKAVASGAWTAEEVTAAHLARAELLNDSLGAFARLTPELALSQARAVDSAIAGGAIPGPLAGVPCPIKDLTAVAGVGLEAGSAVLRGNVAQADEDVVDWLRAAGTTMLGKTATPEFGLPCYTEPEGAPAARTPWDLRRSAGGSSGGAAAAVAAGLAPIAHGSDGGGSIRIPAASCGLVGLKASRGRVSQGRHRMPGPGLASDGVLSRTVADTALALDVLAGHGVGETYLVPGRRGSFLAASRTEPQQLRIGVLTQPLIVAAEVHPACFTAVDRAASVLSDLGHVVVGAPAPFTPQRWAAFAALWTVGAASIELPPAAEAGLRPLTQWLREQGRAVSGVQYAAAVAAIQELTMEVAQAWADFDLILTPTLAQPPALVGALRNDADPAADFLAQTQFTPWTSAYNFTGRPAISLPTHTEVIDGVRLPIGVMLGADLGQEALLLSVATQLEQAIGWQHPFVTGEPGRSA